MEVGATRIQVDLQIRYSFIDLKQYLTLNFRSFPGTLVIIFLILVPLSNKYKGGLHTKRELSQNETEFVPQTSVDAGNA